MSARGKRSAAHKALRVQFDRLRNAREAEAEVVIEPAPKRATRSSSTKKTATKKASSKKKTTRKKATAKRAAKDDLQVLNGVGPAFEKRLNAEGVRTYEDIVALTKDELDDLCDAVGTTGSFARKNRWIQTAKREHKAKYGEALT